MSIQKNNCTRFILDSVSSPTTFLARLVVLGINILLWCRPEIPSASSWLSHKIHVTIELVPHRSLLFFQRAYISTRLLMAILVGVSMAMMKQHDQKWLGNIRTYSFLQLINSSLGEARAGTQGRGLEAETQKEATDEGCLSVCASWLAQLSLLYTQDHLPRCGTNHIAWDLPIGK